MILVTLGTQTMSFIRLLNEIQRLVNNNIISSSVVIQSGYTNFKSDNILVYNFINPEELHILQAEANIIITHGGVGSILECIKLKKKIIAVPRLKKYGEHINDHQLEIVKSFDKEGYLLSILEMGELAIVLSKIYDFVPKEYISNNDYIVSFLKSTIDSF